MPTDTTWLDYLLSNAPGYPIRNDDDTVLALVDAGYLQRHADPMPWLPGYDVWFTLTLAGAQRAIDEPLARVHSAWRRRLAESRAAA